jgi:proteasome lid subunit RPN8/RPN11
VTHDTLEVTRTVFDTIIAHAREGKPEEVCGIVRGRAGRAFQLVNGRNVAPDPIQDFMVDPQTLLRQFDFEEEGDSMIAIYHSHPVSPAYPSASDAWSAHYPDAVYIICSLESDDSPVMRAFRMVPFDVDIDVGELGPELDFVETRPGRFGYYQAQSSQLPPSLTSICVHIPMPFYIVYEVPEEPDQKPTVRVVSISEVELKLVPD